MALPIKISFSKRLLCSDNGPGIAVSRLIKELSKDQYPVSIVDNKPDVFINAINYVKPPNGAKTIFRVDGCYFEKYRMLLNKGIRLGIKNADGVIYQSIFAKKLNDHILGQKPKRFAIIYNGFDQSIVPFISAKQKPGKYLFVSSARWRTSKRPSSIVNGFMCANIKNSHLVMIGKVDREMKGKNVIWLGPQPPDVVLQWYKAADAMIHLCYIDSCPNSVVEGLSFGLPILCNNIGGTPELVRDNGIVISSDYFDFKMIPQIVDNIVSDIVSEGIREIMDRTWNIHRPDLDISMTARKYCQFIQEITES